MENKEDLVTFAEISNSLGSGKPSEKAREIMRLYSEGVIDLETAEKEIDKLHNQ